MESRNAMLEALSRAKQAMSKSVIDASLLSSLRGGARPARAENGGDPGAGERCTPEKMQPTQSAKANRSEFLQTWVRRINLFVNDATKTTLELPVELSANDRRELHMIAEKFNLSHHSENVGSSRQLTLKKDVLHYKPGTADLGKDSGAPNSPANAVVTTVNLDELMTPLSADAKESKYHLRRVHRPQTEEPGGFGSYADEEVAKAVRRLERATNQYRKATVVGMTQEEMLTLEKNQSLTVEAILASKPTLQLTARDDGDSGGAAGATIPSHPSIGGRAHPGADSLDNAPRLEAYEEICLGCGTHAAVDYDVSRWECFGYCALCGKDAVWKLQIVQGKGAEPGHMAGDASAPLDAGTRKRDRGREHVVGAPESEQCAQLPTSRAESIDRENEPDDTLTVNDAVDTATMNDMNSREIGWIQRFATYHSDMLYRRLAFCIEYDDALSMPVLQPEGRKGAALTTAAAAGDGQGATKKARQEPTPGDAAEVPSADRVEPHTLYIRLQESKETGESLSSLLDELVAAISTGLEPLSIVFPNSSVYGTEASCLCMVHPASTLDQEKLRSLQRRFGTKHVDMSDDVSQLLQNH